MTYNIYPTSEGESSVLRGNVSILIYLEVFSIFLKVYLYNYMRELTEIIEGVLLLYFSII